MNPYERFESRIDDIIDAYRRDLERVDSALVTTPETWEQCRRQASEILAECAAAMRGQSAPATGARHRTKIIGLQRALQEVPIAQSVEAGFLLWEATIKVMRQVMLGSQPGFSNEAIFSILTTLHHSINSRLRIGAEAHDSARLVSNHLLTSDTTIEHHLPNEDRPALTAREQQILEALADGSSNREIGHRYNIAENTVKRHVRNIYSKLNVGSRVEAVNVARVLWPETTATDWTGPSRGRRT